MLVSRTDFDGRALDAPQDVAVAAPRGAHDPAHARGGRARLAGRGRGLLLGASLLLSPSLLAEGPRTDPRQWMVELEGEPAVEAWIRGRADGSRSALAAAATATRVAELRSAQARVEEALTAPAIGARVQYRVTRAYNGIAVFAEPSRVEAIRALPGVRSVKPLVLHTLANATSVPHLGVPQGVWQALANAGDDVRVGVIDSGLDYQHAMFGGTGREADYRANDRTKVNDGFFPTARVVGGWDFAGDDYGGGGAATPDPDPMDCGGHGTHVAGSVGGSGVLADGLAFTGPYDGSVPFGTMRIGPGVAPRAKLYALRVFGCSGSTGLTTQAIDWAMDPNDDGDFSDRLDVLNLSLGSEFGSKDDSTAIAAENASRAGIVVVCSAGNAGDTYFVTGSPAAADSAVSVAASVDAGVTASFVEVLGPASLAGRLPAGTAVFGNAPAANGTIGPLAAALPARVCSAVTNGAELEGKIALIDRGDCSFDGKVKRAQDAGAIGVVVANNEEGVLGMAVADPAVAGAVTIPAVLVALSDGNRLKASLAEGVTVALFSGSDTLGSFSSRGPRFEGTAAGPKPDVAAPGVSITSAATGIVAGVGGPVVNAGNLAVSMSGTSMAAPHLTGVMALLRKQRPSWSPAELKAAVMSTAGIDVSLLPPSGSPPQYGPARVGAGRVDPARALATEVIVFDDERPSVVSLSAFLQGTAPTSVTRRLRILNKGSAPATLTPGWATPAAIPGVRVDVPGAPITVPPGGSATFDVNVVLADPAAVTNAPDPTLALRQPSFVPLSNRAWMTEASGFVTLSGAPAGTLRVPLQIVVRGQSAMRAASRAIGAPAAGGSFTIPLAGNGLKTGPLSPVDALSTVSAFELHAESPRSNPEGSARAVADLAFVGAASSLPAGRLDSGATVWFGIATWAEWVSPAEVRFEVEIDRNGDGIVDATVESMSTGDVANPSDPSQSVDPTDVWVARTEQTFGAGAKSYRYLNVDPASRGTHLFASNVVVVPASAGADGLGLTAGNARFRYRVKASTSRSGTVDQTSWLTFDAEKPGYSILAADATPFHDDLPGSALPARFDPAAAQANGALGILLLHHHNAYGARAEALTGRNSPPAVTILEPAPGAAFDAAAPVRFRASGTDADAGDALTYSWSLGDGRVVSGADVTTAFGSAGARVVIVTATDGAGATATAQVAIEVRAPQAPSGTSKLVPVVLDVKGVGGAPFTTELTLVSRSASAARALLTYTASAGAGSGWAGIDLGPGETKVLPDAIEFLRTQGLAIPDDGSNQIGTLRVTLPGASEPAALFVGGRTSTPGEDGAFGLFYADAVEATGEIVVAGLQQSSAMRSNLAVVNAGPEPVKLRLRLEGASGEVLGVLDEPTLPAWGWKQYDQPLLGRASSGRARVLRLAGDGPFSAYGVLNDSGTSDGSYVPPLLAGGPGAGDRLVPVVLDVKGLGVNRYATELTLTNLEAAPVALTLAYTAALGGGSGDVPVTLAGGEQRTIPDVMAFLRSSGLAIPAGGLNVAGSLLVKVPPGRAADLLAAGARVSTRSSVRDGAFGVFFPGLTHSEAANGTTWVHGLQQDAKTRSNVALVNFGDAGSVTLRLTFYGASGQALGGPEEHALAPGAWLQRNEPLLSRGAAAGSVRVERVSGTSRFVAYGVLNDAATSDGSYLPMAR